MGCAPVCEVDCERSEAVVELLVDVSLNGGDLLLLSGF